jgi:hypothetical protein
MFATRNFQSEAAREKDECIQIKNTWQRQMAPIIARTLTDDERTGEGREGHRNCGDSYPDSAQCRSILRCGANSAISL